MALREVLISRISQPSSYVPPAQAFLPDLIGVYCASLGPVNLVTGHTLTPSGAPALAPTRDGAAWHFTNDAWQDRDIPSVGSSGLTLFAIVESDNSDTGRYILSIGASDGSDNWHALIWDGNAPPLGQSRTGGTIGNATGATSIRFTRSVVALTVSAAGSRTLYVDGLAVATDTTTVNVTACDRPVLGALWRGGIASDLTDHKIPLAAIFRRALSAEEHRELAQNPWKTLFPKQSLWRPVAAAGVTHATSGTLSSDAATVAGAVARTRQHATTGALAGSAATIAGTAAHVAKHATSGALSAQAATLAGTATRARAHPTTGVLTPSAATVAGDAARASGVTTHPTTGALSVDVSTLTGTAARTRAHPATGVLQPDSATVTGTAVRRALHATAGVLTADVATVSGAAARKVTHAAIGALQSDAATVSGAAQIVVPGLVGQGNLSFEWPPRDTKRKRNREIDGLREELELALGIKPQAEPETVQQVREQVRLKPPPELAQALAQIRKPAPLAEELPRLRQAVREAQAAVEAESIRRIRRRKQQQTILLLS